MTVFHILFEFCRTKDQRPMSCLKLCLSGKHSEFKQMFPTPMAEFQQSLWHKLNLVFPSYLSLCESYLFGDYFHTQPLCASHVLLSPHFYTAVTHFTGSSLLLVLYRPAKPHSTFLDSCFWDLFLILEHPFAEQRYSFSSLCPAILTPE